MRIINGSSRLSLLLPFMACWFVACVTEGPDDYKDHFIKYYGGDGNQVAADFLLEGDEIFMVGTSFVSNPEGGLSSRIYIVKADAEGNIIWSKTIGEQTENVRDIDVFTSGANAGNYMILSNLERGETDTTSIKVLVVSPEGQVLDSIIFNNFLTQFGNSITALSDGGFVVVGNADGSALTGDNNDANFTDEKDIISLRYDQNLNLQNPPWKTSFEGEPYAMGVKILEPVPGQFKYAGYSDELTPPPPPPGEADGSYDKNFFFTNLSVTGDPVGTPLYSGSQLNEYLAGTARSSIGFYMAVGTQVDGNDSRLFGCTLNSSFTGFINQGEVIDGDVPDHAEAVAITNSKDPNSFWVLGNEILGGGRNIWVGKVNSDLSDLTANISFTFGGNNNDDVGNAIVELPNGDLLILATMELVNQKKMALIKVTGNGQF